MYKKPIIEAGGIQLAVKLLGDTKDEKPARLLMYLLAGGAGSESANQALLEEPGAVPSLVEVLQNLADQMNPKIGVLYLILQ